MSKQNTAVTFNIDFLESYSHDDIVRKLQRLSKIVNGRTITKQDIIKHGRVSYQTIYKKFGGLSKAIMAAGMKPNICHNVPNEELLGTLIDLWSLTLTKDGRRPERRDIKRYNFLFQVIRITDVLEVGKRHLLLPTTLQGRKNQQP